MNDVLNEIKCPLNHIIKYINDETSFDDMDDAYKEMVKYAYNKMMKLKYKIEDNENIVVSVNKDFKYYNQYIMIDNKFYKFGGKNK